MGERKRQQGSRASQKLPDFRELVLQRKKQGCSKEEFLGDLELSSFKEQGWGIGARSPPLHRS